MLTRFVAFSGPPAVVIQISGEMLEPPQGIQHKSGTHHGFKAWQHNMVIDWARFAPSICRRLQNIGRNGLEAAGLKHDEREAFPDGISTAIGKAVFGLLSHAAGSLIQPIPAVVDYKAINRFENPFPDKADTDLGITQGRTKIREKELRPGSFY
jgi:hypothetical protein